MGNFQKNPNLAGKSKDGKIGKFPNSETEESPPEKGDLEGYETTTTTILTTTTNPPSPPSQGGIINL